MIVVQHTSKVQYNENVYVETNKFTAQHTGANKKASEAYAGSARKLEEHTTDRTDVCYLV